MTSQEHPRSTYVLVSPCRNEAAFVERTLESIATQTLPPVQWIVVDDGSTDRTPEILQRFESRLAYLTIVRRQDRGKRAVGAGVIEAFYEGLDRIDFPYEFIGKLDMDLILPPRYFERLVDKMREEPRLGSISGKPYYIDPLSGKVVLEGIRDHMSVGASKFVRRACFEQIGGFEREIMWDGIDCHRARMLGWLAGSYDEPDLRFEHLRPMGSSDRGWLVGRKRHGYGQYFIGTSFAFMTASALSRLNAQPKVIGAFMMWWGFVDAMLRHQRRYAAPDFVKFLRRWQRLALLKGTTLATKQISQERAGFWRPSCSCGGLHGTSTNHPGAAAQVPWE
jgi:glycosyltransferase involved in cell wall biosynthesis